MVDDWQSYQRFILAYDAIPAPIDSRRLRLFVAAICRRILRDRDSITARIRFPNQLARDKLPRDAITTWEQTVTAVEQYADGLIDGRALIAARHPKSGGPHNLFHLAAGLSHQNPDSMFRQLMDVSEEYGVPTGFELYDLLCDVFREPRKQVMFEPEWRTSSAVGLAQSMYESRNFSPMPILADALEEAGCDNPDILTHCRGDGPHVRGCWVVDLVLGKA